MASSGTLTFQSEDWNATTEHGIRLKIDWSCTQDAAKRESYVTFKNARMTAYADGQKWITCRLVANGTAIIQSRVFRGDFGGYSQWGAETVINYTGSGGWPRTITVKHDADGSKTISVSLLRSVESGETSYTKPYADTTRGTSWFAEQTVEIELPAISVGSTFSVSGTTIGSSQTISITRASSSFTHKLYYTPPGGSKTLLASSVGTSYTHTIQASWGGAIPSAMSGTWTYTCETYSGATQTSATLIGTSTLSVTLYIPSDCAPTVSSGWATAGYTNSSTAASGFTRGVKGISKLTFSFDNSKITVRYGATISSRKATINGAEVSAGRVLDSVSTTVRMTVTDSRGKTRSADITVTVSDYSAPTLTGVSAVRSSSAGTARDDGTYYAAKATANYSSVGGENTITLKTAYKQVGGSYGSEVTMTSGTAGVFGAGNLAIIHSYVVRITVADRIGNSAQVEINVPTSEVTFNARNGGKGFAFGKYAEHDNALEVAWDLVVDGGGNIAKAPTVQSADIDAEFDATTFHTRAGAAGTFPSGANGAGAGIVLPYRKPHGNETPDYAGQIWIPPGNRDPDNMYFRTSTADAWDAWQRVLHSTSYTLPASSTVDIQLAAGKVYIIAGGVGSTASCYVVWKGSSVADCKSAKMLDFGGFNIAFTATGVTLTNLRAYSITVGCVSIN